MFPPVKYDDDHMWYKFHTPDVRAVNVTAFALCFGDSKHVGVTIVDDNGDVWTTSLELDDEWCKLT